MPQVRTTTIPASQVPGDLIPGDVSTSEASVLPDVSGDLPGRTATGYEVPAGQRATTPAPANVSSRAAKPNPKDYSDLFGDDNVKPTKTAGPAVADSKPNTKDYADLFEDTGTEKPPTAPAQPSSQQGLFSGVPGFIREHPYASGALAAVLAAPVLGLAPEIGIPVAGALMSLLRNRAIQTGTGIALGQQFGPRASEALHYLLRLSGAEGEQAP